MWLAALFHIYNEFDVLFLILFSIYKYKSIYSLSLFYIKQYYSLNMTKLIRKFDSRIQIVIEIKKGVERITLTFIFRIIQKPRTLLTV